VNLIERSKAFQDAAGELDALRASATIVQATGSRASQLEATLAKLRLAIGRMTFLRGVGIEVVADVNTAAALRQRLKAFQADVSAAPAAVNSTEFAPRTLNPIGALADRIDAACLEAWSKHVRQRVPRVNADLVLVLRRVTVLRGRIDKFNALQTDALKWEARLPAACEDFDRFESLAAECTAAWQAVGADGIPRQVAEFLQRATSDAGAEFASYGAVSDWIRANGLETSLVIRIR